MIKLVIFDLDGTLLDTLSDLTAAVNASLSAYGFPPRTREEVQQFVGNGVSKLLERALPAVAHPFSDPAQLRARFETYYDAHLWDATTVYPGMDELLSALQARGVQMAVASNKYQSATERLIEHFFPSVRFAAVCGQQDRRPRKPHPQIVEDILKETAVTPQETLCVGDSAVDMQTARNAGVRACGVTWGFRLREELKKEEPAWIVDTPQQILEIAEKA